MRGFDYQAYFLQQPEFARLFAGYEFRGLAGRYRVFRRFSPQQTALNASPNPLESVLRRANGR